MVIRIPKNKLSRKISADSTVVTASAFDVDRLFCRFCIVKQWLVAVVFGLCCLTAHAQQYYGNGYTIIAEDTSRSSDDLSVMVYKTIKARSVKDGLRQLLHGSGWRLADKADADSDITRL